MSAPMLVPPHLGVPQLWTKKAQWLLTGTTIDFHIEVMEHGKIKMKTMHSAYYIIWFLS